jgi:hypothetical protein
MPAGFRNKRVKPNLSRPVVDLDRTGVTREWRTVEVQDLEEDDIVSGMGRLVMGIQPTCNGQVAICAGYPDDKFYFMHENEKVLAFVKKES